AAAAPPVGSRLGGSSCMPTTTSVRAACAPAAMSIAAAKHAALTSLCTTLSLSRVRLCGAIYRKPRRRRSDASATSNRGRKHKVSPRHSVPLSGSPRAVMTKGWSWVMAEATLRPPVQRTRDHLGQGYRSDSDHRRGGDRGGDVHVRILAHTCGGEQPAGRDQCGP